MFNITTTEVKRCSKCLIMEDRSVGINIGSDGVCNHCKREGEDHPTMPWDQKKQVFEDIINSVKGKHAYDGVIMMSGGKDSTYLAMKLKKEYGLNVIGMSVDNGFEYMESFENAKLMCDKLGIPYIIYQPDMPALRKFYRYVTVDEKLKRDDYGQICFYCGVYLKRVVDEFAQKFDAPLVFSGYNPDQVAELGETDITEVDESRIQYLRMIKKGADEKMVESYNYTKETQGEEMAKFMEMPKTKIVYYYQHFPYDPLGMIDIIKNELDWEPIKRFRKNYVASGCKLACALIHFCQIKQKPDYIQKEFCSQIRRGNLDKGHVERLLDDIKFSDEEINEVLQSLDLTSEQMLSL
jgi:PP-loop superfamily ATP-utilizing enzyme